MHKARELVLSSFCSNDSCILNIKRNYRMTSRKITEFVTFMNERRQEDIENSAIEVLLDYIDNVTDKFNPFEVFNTDQPEFAYTVCTKRTFSYMGERATLGSAQSLNALTHSYTIQPLLDMDGHMKGKLWVNLQEPSGKFGPRVTETLDSYTNLFTTCSKFGKLTTALMRTWVENVFKGVVKSLYSAKCVLYE